jgi:hypothetical protein
LACGPEFSVEFYAPPELKVKVITHRVGRTSDLQIINQVFYHCATATLCLESKDIYAFPVLVFFGRFCSYRKPNFPAVSGSSLPGFSGRICSYWQPNFPAVSAGIFWPYLSWHQKAGIFRPYLLFLAGIFRP